MDSVFSAIRNLGSTLRGIVDQINPLSETNITLYFIWLVIIVTTGVAVWRAERRWVRGVLYLVHQTVTIGVVINWITVVVVAYHFWEASLVIAAFCFVSTFWICRRRKPRPARLRGEPPR